MNLVEEARVKNYDCQHKKSHTRDRVLMHDEEQNYETNVGTALEPAGLPEWQLRSCRFTLLGTVKVLPQPACVQR